MGAKRGNGQKNVFARANVNLVSFVAWIRMRFQSWLVLSDSFLFQLLAVCFLVNVFWMFELDSVRFIGFSSGVWSLVLLDCGQFALSALSFEIRRSTFDGIDGRSAPFPRFEIRCMNSTAVAGFEMWPDELVVSCDFFWWITGYDRCLEALFWSFSPAWEAVELILSVCVCVSMRKSRDILEACLLYTSPSPRD